MKKTILLAACLGIAPICFASESKTDIVVESGDTLEIGKGTQVRITNGIILNGEKIHILKGGNFSFCGKFIATGDWEITDDNSENIYGRNKSLGIDKLHEVLKYEGDKSLSEVFTELRIGNEFPPELAASGITNEREILRKTIDENTNQ